MSKYHPESFFDLSTFQHKQIFNQCENVWEALSLIPNYLEQSSLGKIEVEIPEGVYLVQPELITIEKGTVIEPTAYIKGPCWIGKNCSIRHGAYIRGNVITGDGCVIGHASEVKNSIFLNKAHAAHFAYVGDSILGNHINLGAGTKCANLKLDNQSVAIWDGGQKIDSGLRKFGAIIGDRSQIGCNAVTNPGTLLGKGSTCYPCVNIGGFIEEGRIVKDRNQIISSKGS